MNEKNKVITEDRTVLVGYSEVGTVVEIPEGIDAIDESVMPFAESREIEEVILPSSLVRIPPYLFQNCRNLVRVKISKASSLESIGKGAFQGCTSLVSIDVPQGVCLIEDDAFVDTGFALLSLPTSIRFLGKNACGSAAVCFVGEEEMEDEDLLLFPDEEDEKA